MKPYLTYRVQRRIAKFFRQLPCMFYGHTTEVEQFEGDSYCFRCWTWVKAKKDLETYDA
jgi:hypothetical protein